MSNRNVVFLKWLFFISQLITLSTFYFSVNVNKEIVMVNLFLWVVILFVRKAFADKITNRDKYIKSSIIVEFIIVALIMYFSQSVEVNLYLLLLMEIVFYFEKKPAMVMIFLVFIASMYPITLDSQGFSDLTKHILAYSIFMFLIYLFVFSMKQYFVQNEKLSQTTTELQMKTIELEKAYEKLQESYDIQEEIIVLKERNRIAGDIHDTVGHVLTTVLVEIEAGKRLISKNKFDLGMEKITLAQEQVRKGMHDIRKSVRALKDETESESFIEVIHKLISDTEKHTGITIVSCISEIPILDLKLKKIIYRALQEGLTNGIKHGKSKKFRFELDFEKNVVHFLLRDYGGGCEKEEFGFGLSNMKYRVEQEKGTFNIHSKLNEGFNIEIQIPYGNKNKRCNT